MLCRAFANKTIGVVGDSTSQQFAISLAGFMTGDLACATRTDPPHCTVPFSRQSSVYGPIVYELCPQHDLASLKLVWQRLDTYPSGPLEYAKWAEVTARSDILVLNWGVHFQPEDEVRARVARLSEFIKRWWPPRPPSHVFWRASYAALKHCPANARPLERPANLSRHKAFNAAEVMAQDRNIVQPAIRAAGGTVLRVEDMTMMRPDGHRQLHGGRQRDCLHFCLPGPTDIWAHIFYDQLMRCVDGAPWKS